MEKIIDLNQISLQEKLQLIDNLWMSVLTEENEIDSPKWHSDILAKRMEKIEKGNAEFISINELKKR